jgi:hypothetical protein
MPKHGELRLWWIPQVPGKVFRAPVASVLEARLLYDTLADYDAFQFKNRIKPDYANAGGLEVFDDEDDTDGPGGSWYEWEDQDGRGISDYTLDELRAMTVLPNPWHEEGAEL